MEAQVARIVKQKKNLEAEHEQMKTLVQKKSKLRNVVEVKSEQAKKKVQKLAGEAQNLRDLLSRLEKQQQEKRRKQEEERRRLAALEEQRRKEAEENQKREQVKTADLIKFKPEVINEIGYNRGAYRFDGDSCGIVSAVHEQSQDINRGVEREADEEQGAGDQGMMFGYATDETETFMPLTLDLSHKLLKELAAIRREGRQMTYERKGRQVTYLRPDSKSQVTVEYEDDGTPARIHTIVVSTQHDDFIQPAGDTEEARLEADRQMLDVIRRDVKDVLLPRVIESLPEHLRELFDDRLILHVNPTGKFVIGGPHGDTGLTGRKS